jgi:hypothetical protein
MGKDKHPGGRPPIYKTTEELDKKIEEYFKSCETEYAKDEDGTILTTSKGPIILSLNAPSLPGMALFLGYASRQSIYDNEKKVEFSYSIKKARSKVEEWIYQASILGTIHPSVGIFMLKQFGYTDRQQIEYSVDTSAYEELQKLYGHK